MLSLQANKDEYIGGRKLLRGYCVEAVIAKRTSWNTVQKFMFRRSFWPCTYRIFYDTLCTFSIIVVFFTPCLFFSLCIFVYVCSTYVFVKKDWYIVCGVGVGFGRIAVRVAAVRRPHRPKRCNGDARGNVQNEARFGRSGDALGSY